MQRNAQPKPTELHLVETPGGRTPDEPRVASAEALAARLAATSDLADRLRIAFDATTGRVVFSTSLGMEDQAIVHAISVCGAPIEIFTLDTGRLFPETIDTLVATELRYAMRIRVLVPDTTDLESLVAADGTLGMRTSVAARKACCEVRKVAPLGLGLAGAGTWITGLRREQSGGRAEIALAAWDQDRGLVKINPVADWTLERLKAYVRSNNVPLNPLHALDFASIGCQPCTRAVRAGEDLRAGRWWWENEDGKECGLHNRLKPAVIGR